MADTTARNIVIFSKKELAPKGHTNNTAWVIYGLAKMGKSIESIQEKYGFSFAQVQTTITNVANLLEKKGLVLEEKIEKIVKGRKLQGNRKRNLEIYRRYYEGFTQQELADRYGVSKTSICKIIGRINRQKGFKKGQKPVRMCGHKVTEIETMQIYERMSNGEPRAKIASDYDISTNSVTAIYQKVVKNKKVKGEEVIERKFPLKRNGYTRVSDKLLRDILKDSCNNISRKEMAKKYNKTVASIDYCIKTAKERGINA